MFKFEETEIKGVTLIVPDTYEDHRGFFRETYKESAFADAGCFDKFTQGNCSLSRRGVLRGLHFQTFPAKVAKLVTIVYGSVFDVAVDVRPDSPTFGDYVGRVLTGENGHALYVPRGFAHGFLALEDDTVASYLMAGEFSSEHDAGLRYDDSDVGIDWDSFGLELVLTDKDRSLPGLRSLA